MRVKHITQKIKNGKGKKVIKTYIYFNLKNAYTINVVKKVNNILPYLIKKYSIKTTQKITLEIDLFGDDFINDTHTLRIIFLY